MKYLISLFLRHWKSSQTNLKQTVHVILKPLPKTDMIDPIGATENDSHVLSSTLHIAFYGCWVGQDPEWSSYTNLASKKHCMQMTYRSIDLIDEK